MAAASVGDDVAWLEVDVGKTVDIGTVVVATFPDDVGETVLSEDDAKTVPSDVVAYKCCKHALIYEMMTRLTEVGADVCSTVHMI